MANYEREFSHFPDQKIVLHNFVNVDDSTIDLINKIDELRNNKKFAEAQNFIEQNADKVKQCIADAVTFRTWEEEIYNTQVYAKQVQQRMVICPSNTKGSPLLKGIRLPSAP